MEIDLAYCAGLFDGEGSILKKEQAEIALEASKTMGLTGAREKLPAEVIMQRRIIVAKFEEAYQRRRNISYGN